MRAIVLDIDSLRPDHLGCYGYPRPTSLTIDTIAEGGVRYDRYYYGSSPCMPSRAGFFTGRDLLHHGLLTHTGPGSQLYLPTTAYRGPEPHFEVLRRHGLRTASIANFADRHSAFWFTGGWSEFYSPNLKAGTETAAEVNQIVLPWLAANAATDDWLLHINYWDIHRCYKHGRILARANQRYAGAADLAGPGGD